MSLIETLVYIVLLSVITASFLNVSYGIHLQNVELSEKVQSAYEEDTEN